MRVKTWSRLVHNVTVSSAQDQQGGVVIEFFCQNVPVSFSLFHNRRTTGAIFTSITPRRWSVFSTFTCARVSPSAPLYF